MAQARRGYSKEFPATKKVTEKRVAYLLDYIPPGTWRSVRAKARREGRSIRSVLLTLLEKWVEE